MFAKTIFQNKGVFAWLTAVGADGHCTTDGRAAASMMTRPVGSIYSALNDQGYFPGPMIGRGNAREAASFG